MAAAICAVALGCSAAAPSLAKIALRGGDPRGELSVDGAPAGALADYAHKRFLLRPGHHVFEVRTPGGPTQVREADVGPGDDVAIHFTGAGAP